MSKPKLLDRVRLAVRRRHYSHRTEEAYVRWVRRFVRPKNPRRLPVVLTREEVRAVMTHPEGNPHTVALLLYGAGLRLLEALRLRVKDVDFDRRELAIRDTKGKRDRVTVLPRVAAGPLRTKLERGRRTWERDLRRGGGWVALPNALDRKYPRAGNEWPWQWLFPATPRSARWRVRPRSLRAR